MTRSLGKVQTEVLRCLTQHQGWYEGCGWLWDTYSGTKRILDSLVHRGFVETHINQQGRTCYKIKAVRNPKDVAVMLNDQMHEDQKSKEKQ